MPFRFWRRIRIAPGVTLNLSKRGASISVGPEGAKFTVGTSGARARARSDLERIYAEDPRYEDVASRLGPSA